MYTYACVRARVRVSVCMIIDIYLYAHRYLSVYLCVRLCVCVCMCVVVEVVVCVVPCPPGALGAANPTEKLCLVHPSNYKMGLAMYVSAPAGRLHR